MKKSLLILAFVAFFIALNFDVQAQCSICNKTVQQLGKGPAQGFNSGIVYLMLIPYIAIGIVGYRWWRSDRGNS